MIYRARAETEKTLLSKYIFTTGIFGIFSHLKNCPVLLYNLFIILFSLQPVEKQIQVRVPLVSSIHKLFVFFGNMILGEK